MGRQASSADVFQAIANPTRRALLDKLLRRERPVTLLAAAFGLSVPAVSQQLKVLRQAGLVSERRMGRHRVYRLNAEPLGVLVSWMQAYEQYWRNHLSAACGENFREHSPATPWR